MTIQPIGSRGLAEWTFAPFKKVFSVGAGTISAISQGLINQAPSSIAPPISSVAQAFQSESVDAEEILRGMGRKIDHFKRIGVEETKVIDWRQKTETELKSFVEQSSMLAVVYMMDTEIETSFAVEIVDAAVQSKRSVYDVFKEKNGNRITWTARWNYFLFYICGILPNTIETFMNSVMNELRSELVQKNGGKNMNALLDRMLSHTSSFLDIYLKAVHDYRDGIDLQGERDVHIESNLKKLQGAALEQICAEFAKTAVREFLPHVSFFKRWQEHSNILLRILGKILIPFEKLFNRILRQKLEEIIPWQLYVAVTSSTDAAQQKNLPFAIAITNGISDQLTKFKAHLALHGNEPSPSAQHVPGAEKLPDVVKKLMSVLELEPYKTRAELQEHERGKKSTLYNPFTPYIIQNIQESMIDASRLFLSFIADPSHSEENFSNILELSNTYFKAPPPPCIDADGTDPLLGKLIELQNKMRRDAKEVFQTVIRNSVKERFQGLPEIETQKLAASFAKQQIEHSTKMTLGIQSHLIAMQDKLATAYSLRSEPIEQCQAICTEMQESAPYVLATPLSYLKGTIDETLAIPQRSFTRVQVLLSAIDRFKQEVKQKEQQIDPALFVSFNKKTDEMLKQLLGSLEPLCEAYNIGRDLEKMIDVIDRYRNQAFLINVDQFPKEYQAGIVFALSPIYLDLDRLVDLCTKADDLQKKQWKETKIALALRSAEKELENCQSYFNEKRIRRIATTFPHLEQNLLEIQSRTDKHDPLAAHFETTLTRLKSSHQLLLEEETTLESLSQLGAQVSLLAKATHAKVAGKPTSFRWKDAEAKVEILLRSLNQEERAKLMNLIDALKRAETLSDLQAAWDQLRNGMQIIFKAHLKAKNEASQIVPHTLESMSHWVKENRNLLESSSREGQLALIEYSKTFVSHKESLMSKVSHIEIKKIEDLHSKLINIAGASWWSVGGGVAGALVGGLATTLGAHVAVPAVLGAAGMIGGKQIKKMTTNFVSDSMVYPQVEKVFVNLYDFVLQPHVWKWAVVDTIQSVNAAYRPLPV